MVRKAAMLQLLILQNKGKLQQTVTSLSSKLLNLLAQSPAIHAAGIFQILIISDPFYFPKIATAMILLWHLFCSQNF